MPVQRLNGVGIYYEILGVGEPVVLLNGVMMTTQSWVLQSSQMRKRYRCVLHDFRGQLMSEKPDGPWEMADHAEDLLALLDHLEIDDAHLIGTSYGGEVALIFASSHPDRVRSLSVVSSVSEVAPETDRIVASWARAALEAPDDLYRISVPTIFSPAFVTGNPEVIAQGEARIRSCPREFFTGLAALIETFRKLDVTAELQRITCPTLVLSGEKDVVKPLRLSRLMAEEIPGAEFLVIPDAGHAVILERPEEVNTALLGFLAKYARG